MLYLAFRRGGSHLAPSPNNPIEVFRRKTGPVVVLTLIAACCWSILSCTTTTPSEQGPPYRISVLEKAQRVESIISGLSVDEKIAQRFIGWIPGGKGTRDMKTVNALISRGIGGFILYPNDFADLEDLASLTAQMHRYAFEERRTVGLLLCADQEGGRVRTLRSNEVVQFPSFRTMSQYNDPDLMYAEGYTLGTTLLHHGIHVNLAPVLDIGAFSSESVIGDRALDDSPVRVTRLGMAFIHGAKASGVASAVKHFPGHGITSRDSHGVLPAVDVDIADIETTHLAPFRTAVENDVEIVMTAHVLYRGIDPFYPASLSDLIINDLLRKTLGFQGIVMSDGISMGALSENFEPGEIVERCFAIGVDLILVHARYDVAELMAVALDQYQRGVITDEMLDESLRRILGLKIELGLTADAAYAWN